MLEAIKGSGAIISTIKQRLNAKSWHTVKEYCEKWEETRQALEDEKNQVSDIAEAQVIKAIKEGDIQTGKWFLSKKAKDRGYGDETPVVTVQNTIESQNNEEYDLDALTPEERDALKFLQDKAKKNKS